MVILFRAAIPSLERRSFAVWDPSSVDYESTSGALIAAHYPGLWKDLERLNDLVSISRNVLTIGEKAQDLAAECAFDQEVFRLVNCCVRVTARGFDGDTGTGDEEKWQWIVNACKMSCWAPVVSRGFTDATCRQKASHHLIAVPQQLGRPE